MPVPIKPISDEGYSGNISNMDYSFLITDNITPPQKKIVASDKDADLLFKIWEIGKSQGDNTICLGADSDISQTDLLRLKSKGFLVGDSEKIKLTKRGRVVITTMALGEPNKFEVARRPKKYTEILASMDKRGKRGYRMASENPEMLINSSNSLNLKDAWGKNK
jgi:hypothetical protein